MERAETLPLDWLLWRPAALSSPGLCQSVQYANILPAHLSLSISPTSANKVSATWLLVSPWCTEAKQPFLVSQWPKLLILEQLTVLAVKDAKTS